MIKVDHWKSLTETKPNQFKRVNTPTANTGFHRLTVPGNSVVFWPVNPTTRLGNPSLWTGNQGSMLKKGAKTVVDICKYFRGGICDSSADFVQ